MEHAIKKHTHIHTHTHTKHTHKHKLKHTHTSTHTPTHKQTHTHTHTQTNTNTHTHTHPHKNKHTHLHTHIHKVLWVYWPFLEWFIFKYNFTNKLQWGKYQQAQNISGHKLSADTKYQQTQNISRHKISADTKYQQTQNISRHKISSNTKYQQAQKSSTILSAKFINVQFVITHKKNVYKFYKYYEALPFAKQHISVSCTIRTVSTSYLPTKHEVSDLFNGNNMRDLNS